MSFFVHNTGSIDRIVRVAIAIVAFALAFLVPLEGVALVLALAVGVIMLLTAALGFCPIWRVLNINTAKK